MDSSSAFQPRARLAIRSLDASDRLMTTFVALPTDVVKTLANVCVDRCSGREQFQEMGTLVDRLQWVIDHREFVFDVSGEKRPMSAERWGIAAGKSRQLVGQTIRRNGGMTTRTVEALSISARVSSDWLVTGKGSPDDVDLPPHASDMVQFRDPFPQRAVAVSHARNKGLSESAIARVCTSPAYNTGEFFYKKSPWWVQEIEDLSEQETRGAAVAAPPSTRQVEEPQPVKTPGRRTG